MFGITGRKACVGGFVSLSLIHIYNPEGKYQTLEKYGTDLTARARAGKIDPVIGRDTETVLKKTASDKKFRAGTIRFVLLSKAGAAGISKKITREDMAEAIEELRRPLP